MLCCVFMERILQPPEWYDNHFFMVEMWPGVAAMSKHYICHLRRKFEINRDGYGARQCICQDVTYP